MSSSLHRSSSFAASLRCVDPARSRIFCSSLNDGRQVILGPTEDYMPREEVLRKVTDVDAIICHGKDKADAEVPHDLSYFYSLLSLATCQLHHTSNTPPGEDISLCMWHTAQSMRSGGRGKVGRG